MKHTLINRFQGSLFGVAIGEALANQATQSTMGEIDQSQDLTLLPIINSIAKKIIDLPNFSLELPNICSNLALDWSSSNIALFLLPLIMFYVDDFDELRENVTQHNSASLETAENLQDGLIWGSAITLALRDRLDLNYVIDSVVLFNPDRGSSQFIKQLAIVNKALKNGKTIIQVEEELFSAAAINQIASYRKTTSNPAMDKMALALSLYCFAISPEDFNLAINLAASIQHRFKNILALTGALSGAYNGFIGIPLKSRMMIRQNPIYCQTINITTQLFNVWSGACETVKYDSQLAIVAPPHTIQTRSSLKIISQTK